MTTFDETATRRRPRGFSRPARSARAAGDVHAGHGGRRLALGVTVSASFLVLAHLLHAVLLVGYFPPGPGPWPAWLAFAATVGVTTAVCLSNGFAFPTWLAVVAYVGLAATTGLDVLATAGSVQAGVTPTAAPAAAAALLPVAALRSTRGPLLAAGAVASVLAIEALVQFPAGGFAALGLTAAFSAFVPVQLGVIAIDGFRRLVRREVDLSLVQSTITTPRTAVGMRASEELVQLDLDAENLLEDVGSGRIPIPVPPDIAATAGSLAARLRIRLIEGRSDTWLRHAITESAYLSGRVRVDDSGGFAGQLSQSQREGLLLTLWLIVGDNPRRSTATAVVRIQLADADADDDRPADLTVVIEAAGILPRHVDPAMRDAVAAIGTSELTTRAGGFRMVITCGDEPRPSQHHAPSGALKSGA
ncbi:hypothetical protein ACDF64_11260 [Agromyces sp. MMS24-JH15]|uniref:hypothetical protein n=1 Tax=Agromyces sp. MMS24-JH15 TaxID=3243765 RepID=UPI003747B301